MNRESTVDLPDARTAANPRESERSVAAAKAIHKLAFGDNNPDWLWPCDACIERAVAALAAADASGPSPREEALAEALREVVGLAWAASKGWNDDATVKRAYEVLSEYDAAREVLAAASPDSEQAP